MFTSSAEVFRTRQSVQDLLEVVHLHRVAVGRLGAIGSDQSEMYSILQNDCVIPHDSDRTYNSILHMAALPDEDFNAFIVATAILIVDRLQQALDRDDLFWNFEAFRDHYLLADAPVRAAIMNGFRSGLFLERVQLPTKPDAEMCLTRQKADVVQLLAAEKEDVLAEAISSDVSAKVAGQLWAHGSQRKLSWSAQAGYRFLFEREASMSPDNPEQIQLIPWT